MNALSKLFETLHLSRMESSSRRSHRRRRSRRQVSSLSCETLEPKQLLAADVAVQFSDQVLETTDPITVALEGKFDDDEVFGTVVKFETNAPLADNDFYVELTDNTPLTNDNFLSYVNSGAYDNSIIHRSVSGFVIQGGAYKAPQVKADLPGSDPYEIPTSGTVQNEPGNLNTRGTIAMAKLSGQPDSATSQFFFNLSNSAFLDSENGGYTQFGSVLGAGMTVVDVMGSALAYNAETYYSNTELQELPLYNLNADNIVQPNDFVKIENVDEVPESDLFNYQVTSSDAGKLTASVDGNGNLVLTPDSSATGSVDITVTATSKLDTTSSAEQTFSVQLNGGGPAEPIIVESFGNTTLTIDPTTNALVAGTTTLTAGGNPVLSSSFSNANILGAEQIDGKNYLFFQYTSGPWSGQYRYWRFDSNWANPGGAWLSPDNSATTYSFETAFNIDLNLDNEIGGSTPTVVEDFGSVTLTIDPVTNALTAGTTTLTAGGNPVLSSTFSNTSILGAEQIDGKNYLFFQYTSGAWSGQYRYWKFDAAWANPGGAWLTPDASFTTYNFESAFNLDLNDDSLTGAPATPTVVEDFGSVTLTIDPSTNALVAGATTLTAGGNPVLASSFRTATLIGAEQLNGSNYLFFQYTSGAWSGQYRYWRFDANWANPAGAWLIPDQSAITYDFESAFDLDLNDDEIKGSPGG